MKDARLKINRITYWVAKKRGYDPEIPRHKKDVEDVRKSEVICQGGQGE